MEDGIATLTLDGCGDPNANVGAGGGPTSGTRRGCEATAHVEFDSEDLNVIVDLPIIENSDIPAFFQ
jgi:hypothetical protein